jgi:hypothetical protein
MANAFQVNDPSTQSGLGTFTNTVTATGLYSVEVGATLPYLASGSAPQSSEPAREITDITFAADSGGSKNSTWFSLYTAGDAYKYYVWFNINSAGVDPAPAGYTAGIEVAGATGATAATLATAAIAAINASGAFTYLAASAGSSGHAIITNKQAGAATNAANGTASYGATFSVTTAGTFGVPEASGLVIKIYNNDVLVATYGPPSPTQPSLGTGPVSMAVTAGNDVDVILSSLSGADALPNAVKTSINFYQGS